MTLTGEYAPAAPEPEVRSYPQLFGISFTPTVSGILIAVLGVGVAAYLGNMLVLPALQESQTLGESIKQKEADLAQKAELVKQVQGVVASVNRANAENKQVRALFSSQAALETLLLDLNRVIVQNQAQLLKFEPDYAASGVITDGSLGGDLNNKLKRQVTTVSFKGNFSQTLNILQAVDRLQTLLVVQNLVTEAQAASATDQASSQNQITSTFKLVAYVPLTPEEIAAAAPPPAAPPP
jgi:type IV pilus assembly protein PilO